MLCVGSSLYACSPKEILGVIINKMKNNLSVKVYCQVTKFRNQILSLGNKIDDLDHKFPAL